MLILWINKSMTTDPKHKLRTFKSLHTYNKQDDGAAMFFVIVKMVCPDKRAGFLDINKNL